MAAAASVGRFEGNVILCNAVDWWVEKRREEGRYEPFCVGFWFQRPASYSMKLTRIYSEDV